MLSFNEVHTDIQQNQKDLIALKTFELNNLKQAVSLMNENNWKDLSFNIQISGDKAELAGITKFDFSNILRNTSNNDYWYNKNGLWTVISAACNEAAEEYYIQMSDYIKNLADIDLCNIHALKSIAKSVGCEYLTDFIKEDYPPQLLNLINLLSIPKHLLFDSYQKLNFLSIMPIMGAIDARNSYLTPTIKGKTKYYRSIILDVANNI
jgi:hypothetical protein